MQHLPVSVPTADSGKKEQMDKDMSVYLKVFCLQYAIKNPIQPQ